MASSVAASAYRPRPYAMNQRTRKFIGTVLMILLVVSYAMLATMVAVTRLAESGTLVLTLYFLLTGILWVVPAGLLIRWMQRP